MTKEDKRQREAGSEQPAKEPYTRPELLVHGNVKEITRELEIGSDDTPMGGGSQFS